MQIDIRIIETLSRVITIDSPSVQEAIDTVKHMYKNEEIVLDYSDFDGYTIIEKKYYDKSNKQDTYIY